MSSLVVLWCSASSPRLTSFEGQPCAILCLGRSCIQTATSGAAHACDADAAVPSSVFIVFCGVSSRSRPASFADFIQLKRGQFFTKFTVGQIDNHVCIVRKPRPVANLGAPFQELRVVSRISRRNLAALFPGVVHAAVMSKTVARVPVRASSQRRKTWRWRNIMPIFLAVFGSPNPRASEASRMPLYRASRLPTSIIFNPPPCMAYRQLILGIPPCPIVPAIPAICLRGVLRVEAEFPQCRRLHPLNLLVTPQGCLLL